MFARFLYYPVGDSLVITEIETPAVNGVPSSVEPSLAVAQDTITLSAQPVPENSLKGSAYNKVFF